MADLAKKREGVQWKRATNLTGLSAATKKLLDTYRSEFERAKASGKALREALNSEWTGKNPDGKDGKVITFNVINGVVNYAWINKAASTEDGETLFPR